ncbi:MAG: hypothetical protein PHH70_02340 [Candidatus Gracilibacteria bacterium]|nr:hypothetical protein [Candidatus Gracilibacteria bacterium]
MTIAQNPLIKGKSVSELLREDLAKVGNSLWLLLTDVFMILFMPPLKKGYEIFFMINEEIKVYHEERYMTTHRVQILQNHEALREKAIIATRYNKGQDD